MKLFLLGFSLFVCVAVFSQEPMNPYGSFPITWGDSDDEVIYHMIPDPSGGSGGMQGVKGPTSMNGYYITGYKTIPGDMKNIYLGYVYRDTVRGEFNYGSSNDDVGYSLADYFAFMAKGTGLAIAGYSHNGTDKDAMLLPVEYNGAISYPAFNYDGGYGDDVFYHSIRVDNNQLCFGYTSTLDNHNDILICRTQNDYYSGPQLISGPAVFGGPGDEIAKCALELVETEFWVGGSTSSFGAGNLDGYLVTLDYDLLPAWDTTFGTPANEEFNAMASESFNGTIVMAGYSDFNGNKDFYIAGYSPYNLTHWTKIIGGTGDEEAFSVQYIGEEGNGYFLITGYTTSYGADGNIFAVKVNSFGEILWQGYMDEPGNQISYSTIVDGCDVIYGGENTLSGMSKDFYLAAGPGVDLMPRVTDISCFGNTDGGVRVFLYGSSYSTSINYFDYLYNNIASGMDSINGLSAGWYHVEAFDMYFGGNPCTFTDSFEIIEPSLLEAYMSSTDVTCTGTADGTATATVTGGVEPYSYYWSEGQETPVATGLSEDITYYVDIYDAHGCYTYLDVTLAKLGLASIYGLINTTVIGDIPDGLAEAELFKVIELGNAELVTSVPVYSMSFSFTDIEPGNYVIKIAVDPSLQPQLLPTYYQSANNWEEGIMLAMDCDVVVDDAVVTINESDVVFDGNGSLSGTVMLYTYTKDAKDVGEPVPGAEIYLEQEPEGEPIAVTETDEEGNYLLGGLPLGPEYSLSVDIPGFPLIQTYSFIPVNSTDSVYENLNFWVDTANGNEGIYTEDPLSSKPYELPGATINAYPNPSADVLTIDITLAVASNVIITINDQNGRLIGTLKKEVMTEGKYSLNFGPENFSGKGIYFISCRINNNVLIKKIIRI
ncbi:MAG: hypothetical protein A2W91_09260 [Bacteroidetes bacterium GWF2_38_335]|nr:MAG: hypothetical protein A2W91_09260 [Bacteroidetes bacterium GWF2_38_335]OFY80842.1 MAG: hypothetical protein A2281_09240 [Bacteroidetes bacterium RIFOXYA12_FULL_38_20]HBS86245.1 hypothetical protein [Bacteroidales bacterium]